MTSTLAPAVITPRHEPSWVTRFDKVFTGPPRSPTPPTSCGPARVASSMLEKHIFRPMLCRPSPSRGRLPWGTGPRRSAAEGARGLHPLASGGRQILQVDRGSTHWQDQIRASSFILYRHRLQVRGPELDHHRQRHPVTGKKFLAFCDSFHIRVDWSAVAHPQTNGQVERANGMILQGLKPRIFNKLNKFAGDGSRSYPWSFGA